MLFSCIKYEPNKNFVQTLSIGITVQTSCWLGNEFKMAGKDFVENVYYLKLDMWAGKS